MTLSLEDYKETFDLEPYDFKEYSHTKTHLKELRLVKALLMGEKLTNSIIEGSFNINSPTKSISNLRDRGYIIQTGKKEFENSNSVGLYYIHPDRRHIEPQLIAARKRIKAIKKEGRKLERYKFDSVIHSLPENLRKYMK